RFLGHLASAWSSSADLGHVWAGQYSGYLFPMAPWFALGHALGIPEWIVHRAWLGTLLFLAAWGVVRLMEVMWERDRGVAHVAAHARSLRRAAGGRVGGRERLVDRARDRPRPLRDELPAVHRAARHDLGGDLDQRVAAPDGLLDELHRRRLRRAARSVRRAR